MKVSNVITILDEKQFAKFVFCAFKNNKFILSTSLVLLFLRNVKSYIALIMVL